MNAEGSFLLPTCSTLQITSGLYRSIYSVIHALFLYEYLFIYWPVGNSQ